jgi:hypothetical protein
MPLVNGIKFSEEATAFIFQPEDETTENRSFVTAVSISDLTYIEIV